MSRSSFHELFPITSLLALLSVGFFVLEALANSKLGGSVSAVLVGPSDVDGLRILAQMFDRLGDLDAYRVRNDGEIWRLLTHAFLHGNLIHLFFNTMVLLDLGRSVEPLLSSAKFFTIYVICAVGAACASVGYRLAFDLPGGSVGASGALAGLIGLMLVYAIKERHRELRDMLIRWIVMIVLITLLIRNVDHMAHAGGFVTGGLLGLTVEDYTTSRSAARWRYPSYVAGAVLAAALGAGLWNHFSQLF